VTTGTMSLTQELVEQVQALRAAIADVGSTVSKRGTSADSAAIAVVTYSVQTQYHQQRLQITAVTTMG
jgi:hypothetical protein